MASADYLKKYLSNESKKKKKSKKCENLKGMKVVEDDAFIMVKPRSNGMPSDDEEIDEADEEIRQKEKLAEKLRFRSDTFQPVDDISGSDNVSKNQTNGGDTHSKERKRHDSDESPQRRRRHDSDKSPPQRRRHDSDKSPPRRRRHDSDESPPRRRRLDSDRDVSPPRRQRQRHDSDKSPPRRRKYDSDESPPRRRQHGSDKLPAKKEEAIHGLDDELSGRFAETKIRTKLTGKNRKGTKDQEEKKAREELKNKELKEKYEKWNRGVEQLKKREEQLKEEERVMQEGFARYADDEAMNEHLKDELLAEDPMAPLISKKREKVEMRKGLVYPSYKGHWPPNRYNIPPGYRWDSVNRSNGFEAQLSLAANKRKADEDAAYRSITECAE